jgi:type I restriction enzyme, S subunit
VLPLPSLYEQKQITSYLDNRCGVIDGVTSLYKCGDDGARRKGILNRQMDTLFAYRKSLIHECVTGQRRVEG